MPGSVLNFVGDNWEFLLTIVTVVVGGWFGLWRFLVVRRAELGWKKTEFVFLQAHYLDTNQDLSEIVKIIEGRHPKIKVELLFQKPNRMGDEERDTYLHRLDKFLNLFDRLQYAVFKTKTLSLDEIEPISWYLHRVSDNEQLKEYCRNYGFKGVLKLAKAYGFDA